MIQDKIIAFIENNKISTSEVSDALGKKGLFEESYPISENMHKVGVIHYVAAYGDSNWPIHSSVIEVEKGAIVLIDNIDCTKALFGEIVSKHIIINKEAKAIVTNGSIRDIKDIKEAKLPIWCKSVRPVGCFNSKPIYSEASEYIAGEREKKLNQAIVVCDDDGVVLIRKEEQAETLLEKLKFIKIQEAKWKKYVFEKKWDTYETICQKKYEDE